MLNRLYVFLILSFVILAVLFFMIVPIFFIILSTAFFTAAAPSPLGEAILSGSGIYLNIFYTIPFIANIYFYVAIYTILLRDIGLTYFTMKKLEENKQASSEEEKKENK